MGRLRLEFVLGGNSQQPAAMVAGQFFRHSCIHWGKTDVRKFIILSLPIGKNTPGSAASAMEWYMGGYTLNSNIYQNDFKTGEAEARQSGRYWEEHVKLMGFSTAHHQLPLSLYYRAIHQWTQGCSKSWNAFPIIFRQGRMHSPFPYLPWREPIQRPCDQLLWSGDQWNDGNDRICLRYGFRQWQRAWKKSRRLQWNGPPPHLGSENSNNWINAYDALILPFYNVLEPSSYSTVLVFAGCALLRRRRSL